MIVVGSRTKPAIAWRLMCVAISTNTRHHTQTHTQLPVLLYQGQFDLKDGPVSNQAWIRSLR